MIKLTMSKEYEDFLKRNDNNMNGYEFLIKGLNEISYIGEILLMKEFISKQKEEEMYLLPDKYIIGDTLGGELIVLELNDTTWKIFCYYEMGPFNDDENIEFCKKILIADSIENFLSDLTDRKAQIDKITDFEITFKVNLPTDYKNFLSHKNGLIVEPLSYPSFLVKELNTEIILDSLFGLDFKDNDLYEINIEVKDDVMAGAIAIGYTMEGNNILLLDNGVYYFDIFMGCEDSVIGLNTFKIDETFGDFCQKMNINFG